MVRYSSWDALVGPDMVRIFTVRQQQSISGSTHCSGHGFGAHHVSLGDVVHAIENPLSDTGCHNGPRPTAAVWALPGKGEFDRLHDEPAPQDDPYEEDVCHQEAYVVQTPALSGLVNKRTPFVETSAMNELHCASTGAGLDQTLAAIEANALTSRAVQTLFAIRLSHCGRRRHLEQDRLATTGKYLDDFSKYPPSAQVLQPSDI
ncbi:unnamed protein product (mitochondrion) [Plasmodiophora brassicae]|uniref:Uncharacterized protein n=1 Tax=Plasmodiophora brassicae TaxID=37360 RepID=A0A3P3YFT8_PLABS|nr:unnamed protein product [Plasmodiophora brassicae]